MSETILVMLEYSTWEHKEYYDSDYHKQVTRQTEQPVNSADDRKFTIEEIMNAV
jgi:hypothetical protein